MKEITIKIPEKKVSFFMELIRQLGLEVTEEVEIPEEHKQIVRERVKKYENSPGSYLSWNDIDRKMATRK
ncbi:MAG TPA: addiction module protein [Bacteroidales bacterium]|nr:addiction module protein [Bacteroidales bacterium]